MHRLFAGHEGGAVTRSAEIAARCNFSLDELRYEYPSEIAEGESPPSDRLSRLAHEGLADRYPEGIPPPRLPPHGP